MTGSEIARNSTMFAVDESAHTICRKGKQPKLKVVGVGGGGCNSVRLLVNDHVAGVTFAAVNTDEASLIYSMADERVLIGDGLGAGGNPTNAEAYAEEQIEDINRLFTDDTDMVFISASMGGGTGTGAAHVVARAAREHRKLVVSMITLPFTFERAYKEKIAQEGIRKLQEQSDVLIPIDNNLLSTAFGKKTFSAGLNMTYNELGYAVKSVSELIIGVGVVNVDFRDVEQTLSRSGSAIIGTGTGEGEHRVLKAFRSAIETPLMKQYNVYASRNILFNIYYSEEEQDCPLLMEEVEDVKAFMAQMNPDIKVIWGSAVDNTLGAKVKITVLVSGFDYDVTKAKAAGRIFEPGDADNDNFIREFASVPAYEHARRVGRSIISLTDN